MPIKSWSTTDADNDDADTASNINWAEGMAPSQVNNSARAIMTQIKQFWDDVKGGTIFVAAANVAGTADAITLTTGDGIGSLAAGVRIAFVAEADNTGAVTVNPDSLGATAVTQHGTALPAGAIKDGDLCVIVYDGTDFELVHPQRNTLSAAANVILSQGASAGVMSETTISEGQVVGRQVSGSIAGIDTEDLFPIARYSNTQSNNTDGGTATSGSYQKYPLNTEDFDEGNIGSIATNQVTLGAGVYEVEAVCVFHRCNSARLALYDTTGAAYLGVASTTAQTNTSVSMAVPANLKGKFTLSVQSVLELRYQVTSTRNTDGLGVAANFSENETFGWIEFKKVG